MPATASHLVGTLAIAAFATSLTIYLYLVINTENTYLTKGQLQMIAGGVAARIVELITMANESNTQSYIQSTLEIPLTVLNSGYWISITNSSGSNGISVNASTTVHPVVSISSAIPLNSTMVNVRVISEEGIQVNGMTVHAKLYGGMKGSLIWARRVGNIIQIGLGVRP